MRLGWLLAVIVIAYPSLSLAVYGPTLHRSPLAVSLAACKESDFSNGTQILEAMRNGSPLAIAHVYPDAIQEFRTTSTSSPLYPARALCIHDLLPSSLQANTTREERSIPTPTVAAYVGEDVTIRFDPRDMGEIRVFYKDRFLCPAVSAELAGETIPLRDIIRVRNQRRRELSSILHDRQQVVDALLQLKKGAGPKEMHAKAAVAPVSEVRIKRYRNE